MKRCLALCLAAALSLGLGGPALAANPDAEALFPAESVCPAFSDVKADNWFAPYVEVCCEANLLAGVGENRFNPSGSVSVGEAAVMAARVLWRADGGSGPLPKGGTAAELLALVEPDIDPESDYYAEDLAFLEPISGSWAWDGLCYLIRRTTEENTDAFALQHHPFEPASRAEFFGMLAFAASGLELPAINSIERLPDTADGAILGLYRAGVLTGTDGYGTFAGPLALTRAEAAAALARVIRPGLRLPFTPAPSGTAYTLTPVDLRGRSAFPPEERYRFFDRCRAPSPASLQYLVYGTQDADGGLWGVLAPDGTALTRPVYRFVGEFGPDGLAAVRDKNGKWGYLDQNGREVVPCRYDGALTNHDGLLLVYEGGSRSNLEGTPFPETYYLLDASGRELRRFAAEGREVSMEADCWWSDGLIPFRYVDYDGEGRPHFRYGYLNEAGETAIPAQFDWAAPFSEGHAVVGQSSDGAAYPKSIRYHYSLKAGVIDTAGAFALPFGDYYLPQYYNPRAFQEGALTLCAAGPAPACAPLSGVIRPDGSVLLPFRYDSVDGFRDGRAFYRRAGQMGFVDPEGRESSFPFDTVMDFDCSFSEGLIAVSPGGGLYGYADRTGRLVIPAQFRTACPIYEGRAVVETDEGLFWLTLTEGVSA